MKKIKLLPIVFAFLLLFVSCTEEVTSEPQSSAYNSYFVSSEESSDKTTSSAENIPQKDTAITVNNLPEYSGKAYIQLENNIPSFKDSQLKANSFESYSKLDSLGRCGVAFACISKETMPTEERTSIGQVKPSGWHTVKYDIVDGKYLYNRCHLIGFQLTGENANERNLITGTRYLNIEGMLPFENMVADYVKETGNHVLYRVTPIFDGNNLVARGVQIEAKSVEDMGEGICFNIYAYNVQPSISIDYLTGESKLINPPKTDETVNQTYVLNINSKRIHLPSCSSVKDIKEANKKEFSGDISELEKEGYEKCKSCLS